MQWLGRPVCARRGRKTTYKGRLAHTFFELVPPRDYFREHPEYFRRSTANGSGMSRGDAIGSRRGKEVAARDARGRPNTRSFACAGGVLNV